MHARSALPHPRPLHARASACPSHAALLEHLLPAANPAFLAPLCWRSQLSLLLPRLSSRPPSCPGIYSNPELLLPDKQPQQRAGLLGQQQCSCDTVPSWLAETCAKSLAPGRMWPVEPCLILQAAIGDSLGFECDES